MSAAFTPGPWEVAPLDDCKYYGTAIRLGAGGGTVTVWANTDEPSSRTLAQGWEPEYGMDHEESAQDYANACLIAAAPSLYDAANLAIEHMEWSTEHGRAAYDALKAALAKARGES